MIVRTLIVVTLALCASLGPAAADENLRRRLQDGPKISREEAEKACAKHAADKEACIFDVMATGDLDMAESW